MTREPLQRTELALGAAARGHADQDHEDRDQRHGEADDHGCDHVLGEHHYQDRHRDDAGKDQLRQVPGEVPVERIHAPGGERRQVGCALLGQRGRTQTPCAP